MRADRGDSSQGELVLGGISCAPADPAAFPDPVDEACADVPDWLRRLDPADRLRVAGLARDGRPLVFLVDARARWNLMQPRLPVAGFDPVDFERAPEGDLRIVAFSDTPVRSVEHLLRCLHRTRFGRAVVCDRIGVTGPRLSVLARGTTVAGSRTPADPAGRGKIPEPALDGRRPPA